MNLGNSFILRTKSEKSSNIEQAIQHFNNALDVFQREFFPSDWARTHVNFGNAYKERISGNISENMENAIFHYNQSLEIFTKQSFPSLWAKVENLLGDIFRHRIAGEKSDNIEQFIKHLNNSLEIFTLESFPQAWATVQCSFGMAYQQRILGDKSQNIEDAIAYYLRSREILNKQSYPSKMGKHPSQPWKCLKNRTQGIKDENIFQSIQCYESSLDVFTRQSFPFHWATTQMNLGIAWQEKQMHSNHLEKALEYFEPCIQFYQETQFAIPFGDRTKEQFSEKFLSTLYWSTITVCVKLGLLEKALWYSTQSQTQSLVEQISMQLLLKDSNSAKAQQIKILRDEMHSLQHFFDREVTHHEKNPTNARPLSSLASRCRRLLTELFEEEKMQHFLNPSEATIKEIQEKLEKMYVS